MRCFTDSLYKLIYELIVFWAFIPSLFTELAKSECFFSQVITGGRWSRRKFEGGQIGLPAKISIPLTLKQN